MKHKLNLKTILPALFFVPMISINLYAQDSLKLFNLVALFTPLEESVDSVGNYKPPTRAEIKILFKISNPEKLEQAFILVGNAENDGNIKNETLTAVASNGDYFLNDVNLKTFKIWGQSCYYTFEIPIEERKNIKCVTVYIKDKAGNISEKKYFKSL